MSYARYSDDSDVYVFRNCDGFLDCVGCGFKTETVAGLHAHLDWHREVGDEVPDRAYDQGSGLDAEMAEDRATGGARWDDLSWIQRGAVA